MKKYTAQAKDMRCIWMTAGVINYKLCDMDFQCEKCEFNKVMQRMLPAREMATPMPAPVRPGNQTVNHLMDNYLYHMFSDCKISLDRYHHSSHFWFKIESPQRVQVGIDKLFIKMLEPVERIIVPEIKEKFRPGQLIAWIVRQGKTLPLYSPVEGKIIEVNPLLEQEDFRQVLNQELYFFKMEGKDIAQSIQYLCPDMLGLECFSKKVYLLREFLYRRFQAEATREVGTTLQDGGTFQNDLEKVLGHRLYQEFIRRLLKGDQPPSQEIRHRKGKMVLGVEGK
jgi:glycine cleavage system H lipoate-binding protein